MTTTRINSFFAVLVVTFSILSGIVAFTPSRVLAAKNDSCHRSGGLLSFPTWYEYLEVGPQGDDPCAIIGPKADGGSGSFDWGKALPRIIMALVDILLRIGGLVSIGFVIYGGFRMITSQGEPEAAKNARKIVTSALIGLAITILATTIVTYLANTIWS